MSLSNRALLASTCAAVFMLAGCDIPTAGPDTVATEARPSFSLSAQSAEAGDEVARAFALALEDASVRARLRNAFRASPYIEHKLVLQEFVATRDGQFLLRAAAEAAGVSSGHLAGRIAAMPESDFYVPFIEHRVGWRGTAGVVVGFNVDVGDPTLRAYDASGNARELDSRDGVPQQIVLIMHPAEPKSPHGYQGGPGETIQDFSEPTYAITSTETEECDPYTSVETCPDEGGGGGSTLSAQLTRFITFVDDGYGSNEVKFFMFDASGTKMWDWRIDGVVHHQWYYPNYDFSHMGAYGKVVEMDSWLTGSDDEWGFSYAQQSDFSIDNRGFGGSGLDTWFVNGCGAVYGDNYKTVCGDFPEAWYFPVTTVQAVYTY